MDIKKRLLEGLDCTIEDLSEDLLVGALLDAYAQAKRRILELEGANAREFQALSDERERLIREQQRLREDPLYAAAGSFFFTVRDRYFHVQIQGYQVSMFERNGSIYNQARPVTQVEFERLTTD